MLCKNKALWLVKRSHVNWNIQSQCFMSVLQKYAGLKLIHEIDYRVIQTKRVAFFLVAICIKSRLWSKMIARQEAQKVFKYWSLDRLGQLELGCFSPALKSDPPNGLGLDQSGPDPGTKSWQYVISSENYMHESQEFGWGEGDLFSPLPFKI